MIRVLFTNAFGPSNRGDAALIESLVAETKLALEHVPHVMHGVATQAEAQRQSVPEVEWMIPPVYASSAGAARRPLEKALVTGRPSITQL